MNLIELHMLQSFPVSCLNRDDVGAPKSAVFGGCQRARVSSQCWKRAIRAYAQQLDGDLFRGQRTRFVVRALEAEFISQGQEEAAAHVLALAVSEAVGKLDDPEKGNVKTLLYFSPLELAAVVAEMLRQSVAECLAVLQNADASKKDRERAEKELANQAKKAGKGMAAHVKDAADIAIFGRMVADDHSLTIEGAGLFSHALSTHATDNEIDFFSAVDDKNEDDEGAGHIGTIEFNSACYYRYVGLNLDLLATNLGDAFSGDERQRVIEAFLRASIMAVPAARKNSMFGFNPPQHVLGLRRSGQPLSLVNAFENPVSSATGYMEKSAQDMTAHWETVKRLYGLKAGVECVLPPDNLDELIRKLIAGV